MMTTYKGFYYYEVYVHQVESTSTFPVRACSPVSVPSTPTAPVSAANFNRVTKPVGGL